MPCLSRANGVKRKHDDDLDQEPREPEDGGSGGGPPTPEYRQSVLNMSLCKLQSPSRSESSLRRSVLICNTLKHIQHQMKVEGGGGLVLYNVTPSEEDEGHDPEQTLSSAGTEGAGSAKHAATPLSLSIRAEATLVAPTDSMELDSPAAPPPTPAPAHRVADSSSDKENLVPPAAEVKEQERSAGVRPERSSSELYELCTTEDFSDVDMSLYDFDLFGPIAAMSIREEAKGIEAVQLVGQPASCRSEYADDLEHIMHILVDVGM